MQETGHNRQERRVLGALTSGQQLGLCPQSNEEPVQDFN